MALMTGLGDNLVFRFDDNLRGAKTLEISQIEISDVDAPYLLGVYDYWNQTRQDKVAPSLRDFRLDELDPSSVPFVTVVDFLEQPFDYCFRFFGSKVVEAAGMELTGKKYYADRIMGFGYESGKIFPIIIEKRQPIATRTTWFSVKSLKYISTAIRLPLSTYSDNIDGCITVYHFLHGNQ